jgi:hypothetical protein
VLFALFDGEASALTYQCVFFASNTPPGTQKNEKYQSSEEASVISRCSQARA